MDLKNRLTKTPYLVLFIVLISIGVGTASALITITLSGDVIITGFLDMTGDKIANVDTPTLASDAATKAYVDSAIGIDTLASLGCADGEIAQFVGSIWTCVADPTYSDAQAITAVGPHTVDTDTLALLGCSTDQVARFDGNNWVCGKQTVKNNPITTVDSTDVVGFFTSIAIGTDNNPVISYYDNDNGDLKVAHCGNTSCTSGNTITTLDSTDNVGLDTSIAIGTDNNPVISYLDDQNKDLKVIHCGNTSCTSGNTITTLDSTDNVGFFTSIAIGTDNNPVISYNDLTNHVLKVAHCGNTSCSTGNTITTVDSTEFTGRYTSIAIGTDGNPVISYWDNSDGSSELNVAHCGDADCAGNTNANTITTVDSAGFTGFFTSIAIGTDNNPVISYFDTTNDDLKVAHCGNTSCSTGNSITIVDSTDAVGEFTSIAIGADGNPVISYFDATNDDLKVVHCGNTTCSAGNFITIVDSTDAVGEYTSIAIGTDNNPVISYLDATNFDLKVAVDGVVLIFE